MSAPPLPESFGRNGAYKVVSVIGRGGFATVYKAYHAALDRHVAVKVLRPEMVEGEGARQRFQIEARASARLAGHPNIVTVYDYGEDDGSAYLVLQLVEGLPFDKRLTTPITAPEIDKIITGVAAALDFAHRNQLIHRDIKPSNVLLEHDGTAILSDFGIAKLLDATASMTNTLLGTPDYMSPEQITGSPLDGRSDIYALGVMVYRVFAGKTPFQGPPMSILHQHVHSPLPDLPPNPLTGRTTPAAVEYVIRRATAKYPEERQATAGQLADELRAALRPQILADQALDALRESDVSRAEGIAAELMREHPSSPEVPQLQQEIVRRRARMAHRAQVAAYVSAQQWQAAVTEVDRLGLRNDADPAIVEIVQAADTGLAAERARQETAWREQQAREASQREASQREAAQREAEAREAARREQEAREAAWREQQAREAAQREAEAREAARREQEAREAAQREQQAREAAWREQQAREAAQREQQAREAAQREQQAREAAQHEAEAREAARREQEARDAEQQRQQAAAAERQRAERQRQERDEQASLTQAHETQAHETQAHEQHTRVGPLDLGRPTEEPATQFAARAPRVQETRAMQALGAQPAPSAAAPAAPTAPMASATRSPIVAIALGLALVIALVGGGIMLAPGALTAILGSAETATPAAASKPTAVSTPAAVAAATSTTAPAAKPTLAPAAKPTTPPTAAVQPAAVTPPAPAPTATTPPAPKPEPPTAVAAKPEAKPQPPTPTTVPPTAVPAPLPTRIAWPDGGEMALIPAGDFQMGQDGDASTGPRHPLTLPDFYVDVTEVTNTRFAKYVLETGSKPEGDWRRFFDAGDFDPQFYDIERGEHPVVNVTWKDADNYCRWAGKRLPYEAEWEKAARGTDARRWPWGNEPHPEFANVENQTEGEPDTKRVGRFPRGISPFGLLDMIGNAREWTGSALLPYPLTQPVASTEGGTSRVTRGGSWLSLPGSIELTRRLAEPLSAAAKDLGFRCAASADQARGR